MQKEIELKCLCDGLLDALRARVKGSSQKGFL